MAVYLYGYTILGEFDMVGLTTKERWFYNFNMIYNFSSL